MTNEEIIRAERVRLMNEGRIGTVRETRVIDEDGNLTVIREPDEIHDYETWRSLGQQVRRGSRAIARLRIRKGRKYETVSYFCRAQCDTIRTGGTARRTYC